MRVNRVLLAGLMLLGVGCSAGSGGGGGGGVALTTDEYGGYVRVGGGDVFGTGDDYITLSAGFVSDFTVTPDPGTITIGATDGCELYELPPDPPPPISQTCFDVGDVRATSNAVTVISGEQDSDCLYENELLGVLAGNTTWTITVGGSAEIEAGAEVGEISVPQSQSATLVGTPTIVPGEPLDLEWNETNSDIVYLFVTQPWSTPAISGPIAYTCAAKDDGSFTVPAAITQAVGSSGYVWIANQTVASARVHDRTVLLFSGRSVNGMLGGIGPAFGVPWDVD